MRFLIIQETDWELRGPHQQHHLMERLSVESNEIKVIDYEFLWHQKNRRKYLQRKKRFFSSPKIIRNARIQVIRPASLRIPILCYISIPIFHFPVIFREILRFKPNYIIGFGIYTSFIGMLIAKMFKIPFYYYIIDHLHTLVPINLFKPISKVVESINIKMADKIFAINQGLIDYSLELGGSVDKCSLIPGGVDLKRYLPNQLVREQIREKLCISETDIIIFFMGWIYDFSGMKEITDFLLKNQDTHQNYKLLIVGDGDLFSYIKQKKKELHKKNQIILTGKIPFQSIPEYLQAADFCVLPAYKNKIMNNIVPIKLYEYIASGNPVIATKLLGVYKEFKNNNGIIYINEPEETFDIIKNYDQKYKNTVKEGQRFVKDYDWDAIVSNFKKAL
ncbi:hypothetical protein NEF87_004312 [Candidatus Lokiarchaeum ossiferum]|uniref:Glycosyl transferase family 1 domain-containing protein n=1 Tax=Candidatus Lokiarchaeum ossiferum TaxID=2951803 RepID=A0ABY6HYT2_9ARCH|nr:hypothetical protein NEF87_004312 [Candidatus Lokiarchaeum sp. B-35]